MKNVLIGDETIVDTTGAGDAFVGAPCASPRRRTRAACLPAEGSRRGHAGMRESRRSSRVPRGDETAARAANVAVAAADFGDDVDDETAAWLGGARRGVDQARLLLRVR